MVRTLLHTLKWVLGGLLVLNGEKREREKRMRERRERRKYKTSRQNFVF